MEMQSNFQVRIRRLTSRTIVWALILGPETNLVGSFWPVINSLTWVPPTSITRTLGSFGTDGFAVICILRGRMKVYRWLGASQTGKRGRGGVAVEGGECV